MSLVADNEKGRYPDLSRVLSVALAYHFIHEETGGVIYNRARKYEKKANMSISEMND